MTNEALLKTLQKFINTPFRYGELLTLLDKQKDFLLQKNSLEKTEHREYNALWDTLLWAEQYFKFAQTGDCLIGCQMSLTKVYDYHFKLRDKHEKER